MTDEEPGSKAWAILVARNAGLAEPRLVPLWMIKAIRNAYVMGVEHAARETRKVAEHAQKIANSS